MGKNSVLVMTQKTPRDLSQAASLNSSLVTFLFYTTLLDVFKYVEHTSTSRLLNLQFPLPGILFPQIISWLLHFLRVSTRVTLSKRLLQSHYRKAHGMHIYRTSLSLPFTPTPLLGVIFSHSVYYHIILFIAFPN